MNFKLISPYRPTGDQPEAIRQLVDGINIGVPYQTLLGVTGSGKTFSVANVIEQVQKPTLVLSHNKTLAAQLYSEFKSFFPENGGIFRHFCVERGQSRRRAGARRLLRCIYPFSRAS